jgi:hypothetical protein
MGVPAGGKHFSVEGTAFLRIADGKVAQLWGFLDQMALLQQIGGLSVTVPRRRPATLTATTLTVTATKGHACRRPWG